MKTPLSEKEISEQEKEQLEDKVRELERSHDLLAKSLTDEIEKNIRLREELERAKSVFINLKYCPDCGNSWEKDNDTCGCWVCGFEKQAIKSQQSSPPQDKRQMDIPDDKRKYWQWERDKFIKALEEIRSFTQDYTAAAALSYARQIAREALNEEVNNPNNI